MISKNMQKALSEQMGREFSSAYLYLAMAGKATEMNLKGAAGWLEAQEGEERAHGMKFYSYLKEQGAVIDFAPLAAGAVKSESLLALFEQVLGHEKKVTRWIYDLVELAQAEKDYATLAFLQWFVTEQVEEEANATDIIAQLKMIGDKSSAIFMIDHQLGKRKAG
ncbi:MAG: ferritin [Kiritimatiellia bacterium]